jgi:hypothetical protein
MAKRKGISKKIRFEVFKRDSFTCQYCGRSAPDVVLEVDHINPIACDGEESIINYITSCFDCNRGKGKRKLNDQSELEKQKQQLKELNEKRLQLEMMLKWREELLKLNKDGVNAAKDLIERLLNCSLTEYGIKNLRAWVKKYTLKEVLEVIDISFDQYFQESNKESKEKVINYIPKICNSRRIAKEKPYINDLYYIRGIIKNRFNYYNPLMALKWLEELYLNGYSIDTLKKIVFECDTWNQFQQCYEELREG